MKLSETNDEIIIRHVPIREWITGGILAFLSLVLCLFLLFAFFAAPRGYYETLLGDWIYVISFFVVIGVLAAFIYEIKAIRAPLTTVSINLATASVNIVEQRLYGKSVKRYYFYQILKFKSYKSKLNFAPHYFLELVLANKKKIALRIPLGNDQQTTVKFIKKLNKHIKTATSPNES